MARQLPFLKPSNRNLARILLARPILLMATSRFERSRRSAGLAVIVLCSSSFVFALNGCKHAAQQTASVTILDPEWASPDIMPKAKYETEQFTRETGVKVEHTPLPETAFGQLDLSRKLLRQHSPSPDVYGIDVIWPGVLAEHLLDLKPYFGAELSLLDPSVVANFTVNGKVVAMPYHVNVGVLAYRTDLLRKYGYERPPRTWDELEQIAGRIQAGERAKGAKDFWGYVWQGAAAEGLTCNALEWQIGEGGGQIIEFDKTISVDNPATIRAWQRAAHWIGWISPPGVVAYREPDSMNLWASGRTAFWRTWQWQYRLSHWQESAMENKTGFTSIPAGRGKRAGTLGGTGLAVSQYAAHPEEAIALIRFLLRRELESRKENVHARPPQTPELYDLPDAVDPFDHSTPPNLWESGVVARPSMFVGDKYEEVTRAYYQSVHSALVGEKSAADAAAELERQLAAITGFKTGPPKSEN